MLRSHYGEGPLHLMAVLASFAIATYAFLEIAGGTAPLNFAIWFAAAIIAHDLLAFPLYSLLGLVAGRALADRDATSTRPPALNYLRVPALLSGFAFIVWFPLILGFGEAEFIETTGLDTDPYLGRWLLLSGVLFAASALVYAVRIRRART
ncbi:MAG: hypothetical protein M3355_05810 [Actinomycetota bacterium]|nr:hypothetical protein [Actinomycetota bacterium]